MSVISYHGNRGPETEHMRSLRLQERNIGGNWNHTRISEREKSDRNIPELSYRNKNQHSKKPWQAASSSSQELNIKVRHLTADNN